MDWVEKVVLVTGGANGIGKAISQAFLNAGATVIVADVDAMNGETVVEEWKKDNLNAVFCKINLVDVAAIIKMFEDLVGRYGKIDVLVNNAGKGIFKPLLELSIEEWDEVIHLNLRAAFVTSQQFAKYHEPNCYGRIINIASTRYLMSEPNSEAYAASKGGIVSLTHALALSLSGKGITVNAISPVGLKIITMSNYARLIMSSILRNVWENRRILPEHACFWQTSRMILLLVRILSLTAA